MKQRPKSTQPIVLLLLLLAALIIFPLIPGPKAWPRGAWDAADHNQDGIVTREEMSRFGAQAPHRNATRLMMHFDRADTNGDGRVDEAEVEVYGTNIGSKDPMDHLPPPTN